MARTTSKKPTTPAPEKLFIWRWIPDGYNSCKATSRAEALAKAKEMGKPSKTGFKGLTVDEKSLHEGTYEELNKLDREYASLFD